MAIFCWEALRPDCREIEQARELYKATQSAAERIPWKWIRQSVAHRRDWRPGERWTGHLLLAAADTAPQKILGFAYVAYVLGLGGYVSYLGVDPAARRGGIGSRLFETAFRVLAVDASAIGVGLPFVVWESRRPSPQAEESERVNWAARLRLFERIGGRWLAGVDLQTPNYADRAGPSVPLQVFLRPWDAAESAFGSSRLCGIVTDLAQHVYGGNWTPTTPISLASPTSAG